VFTVLQSVITIIESDESLLIRRFHHRVQLEAGSLELQLLGAVGSVGGPLFPGQRDEDDEADDGDEEKPSGQRGDYQHQPVAFVLSNSPVPLDENL